MYGLTRASTTLIAAGVAGLLIWIAARINDHSTGGYWAVYGLIAGAGLVMALSQLLGGWTKWGVPRLSATPGDIQWTGGALGQDNQSVYRELGVSCDEQKQLIAAGVI